MIALSALLANSVTRQDSCPRAGLVPQVLSVVQDKVDQALTQLLTIFQINLLLVHAQQVTPAIKVSLQMEVFPHSAQQNSIQSLYSLPNAYHAHQVNSAREVLIMSLAQQDTTAKKNQTSPHLTIKSMVIYALKTITVKRAKVYPGHALTVHGRTSLPSHIVMHAQMAKYVKMVDR